MFRERLFAARLAFLDGQSEDDAHKGLLVGDDFPDVKRLSCIHLARCLSSVRCERGFSLMAILKTKVRNKLTVPTLSALMMISFNGPKRRDYTSRNEYTAAIRELAVEAREHWKAKTKRCISRSK